MTDTTLFHLLDPSHRNIRKTHRAREQIDMMEYKSEFCFQVTLTYMVCSDFPPTNKSASTLLGDSLSSVSPSLEGEVVSSHLQCCISLTQTCSCFTLLQSKISFIRAEDTSSVPS